MININDNNALQRLYTEMNIGFMVPQNGGVSAQHVAIIDQNNSMEQKEEPKDVGQLISCVIDDLNHLKMDVDQGCRGDAQIAELQKCCDNLAHAIEQIGNTSSQQHQSGAFTGAISNDNTGDSGSNSFDMSKM